MRLSAGRAGCLDEREAGFPGGRGGIRERRSRVSRTRSGVSLGEREAAKHRAVGRGASMGVR